MISRVFGNTPPYGKPLPYLMIVSQWGISTLVACRLVAPDKNPGIWPIGIGEILRRLIGKAILCIGGDDLLESSWPWQPTALCWTGSGMRSRSSYDRKCL